MFYRPDIMSGLYIAVILENFELEDEEIKQYQIRQFIYKRVPKTTNRLQTFFDRYLIICSRLSPVIIAVY